MVVKKVIESYEFSNESDIEALYKVKELLETINEMVDKSNKAELDEQDFSGLINEIIRQSILLELKKVWSVFNIFDEDTKDRIEGELEFLKS